MAWHRAKGKAVKVHQRSGMRKCMHDDDMLNGYSVSSYHTEDREALAVRGNNPTVSKITYLLIFRSL